MEINVLACSASFRRGSRNCRLAEAAALTEPARHYRVVKARRVAFPDANLGDAAGRARTTDAPA